MDTQPVLERLFLFGLVAVAFLGPVEAFLRFRFYQAMRRGDGHAYLAGSDPWVTVIVALAGACTVALVSALS
jgi:hypothetical protein